MALLLWASCAAASLHAGARPVPQPLPKHPGNIFLQGEEVTIRAPAGDSATCRLFDYESRMLGEYRLAGEQVNLGKLDPGYYEVLREGRQRTNRVSVGVLEKLRAPTPGGSPICSDGALAWLVPPGQIREVASLAALAGVNWMRDRLSWPEIEPARGQFVQSNRYDLSIGAQVERGLQLLEVTHISPAWANATAKRFPLDLRDAYEYHRQLARRWRGQVQAFEPWNEADIDMFGGHTGSEMASMQKASYLGLKAGNPKVIGCLNVFAIHRRATLDDFAANVSWPYFDTFNLHHYEPFAGYPKLYADFRAVSAGRPLWVTECSLPVKWSGDPALQEPTWEDQRVQSERVAITYALALHERARAVFFFILPHFVEGQTQFGVLHRDLTPRPAFLALAAVGRLLADAQPLGRLKTEEQVHGYAFRSQPDGKTATVMVLWAERQGNFPVPKGVLGVYDHLGRQGGRAGMTISLTRAPVFLVLRNERSLELIPPPPSPRVLPGKPSPVVLQALMPEKSVVLDKSAYTIKTGEQTQVPLFLYNFGSRPARGKLTIHAPEGWSVSDLPASIEILPGQRQPVLCVLTCPPEPGKEPARLGIVGRFGDAGEAVLSMRFVPAP